MSKIRKRDTDGVKPLLDKAEVGYDDYQDKGRVYVGTGSENIPLAIKADVLAVDAKLADVNLTRADKYLAAQDIASMNYVDRNLIKIQYNNATDVDYEVFGYDNGTLTSIQHYTGGVLRGTTTLSYTSGNLVSAIFIGV